MLIENDGKNRYHLEQAGLPDFVDSFVRERLYQDAPDGWPADNEINSLALWLLWLSSSEGSSPSLSLSPSLTLPPDRLKAQTSAQRTQMIRLVLPFVLMPVRVRSPSLLDRSSSHYFSVRRLPHSACLLHRSHPS
jgi:hypothetical protein